MIQDIMSGVRKILKLFSTLSVLESEKKGISVPHQYKEYQFNGVASEKLNYPQQSTALMH